jgi:hypothetical protein
MGKSTNNKGRRNTGRFTRLPEEVLRTRKYASLSAHAVKLLVDLARQYNGFNNGDLCAAFSLMKHNGWRSKGTLSEAARELQRAGFIEQTRTGGRNAGPHLWALTWEPIDDCTDKAGHRKIDVKPTQIPSRLYRDEKQDGSSEYGPASSQYGSAA